MREAHRQMLRDVILPRVKGAPTIHIVDEISTTALSGKGSYQSSGVRSDKVVSNDNGLLHPGWLPSPATCDVQSQPVEAQGELTSGDLVEHIREANLRELLCAPQPTLNRVENKGNALGLDKGMLPAPESSTPSDVQFSELIEEWPLPSGIWADEHSEDGDWPVHWLQGFPKSLTRDEIQNEKLRSVIQHWPAATGIWASDKLDDEYLRWPESWSTRTRPSPPVAPGAPVDSQTTAEEQPGGTDTKSKRGKRGKRGKKRARSVGRSPSER